MVATAEGRRATNHPEWMRRVCSVLILAILAWSVGGAAVGSAAGSRAGASSAAAAADSAAPDSAGPDGAARWSWPVAAPHPIVRPFLAPLTRYSAGHRGIDVAVESAIVLAPADGTVHFAGTVVDRGVVSLSHPGAVLSSYEPIESTLKSGDFVRRGEEIGTLTAGHCSVLCLHFGVRINGEYVSPLLFLEEVQRSVLLPTRNVGSGAGRALRPRVSERVTLAEPLGRDMGVDLGRAEARMPKHLLHGAQIRAPVEQMSGSGVAQSVRPGRSPTGHGLEQSRDERVDGACSDPPAARAEKQRWLVCVAVANGEPRGDGGLCGNPEGHNPFLRPLAKYPRGEATQIDVAHVEPGNLTHPKGGGVQEFHDRQVAHGQRVVRGGTSGETGKDAVHLIAGEDSRQVPIGFRGAQSRGGIVRCVTAASQPGCQSPSGRRAARERRLGQARSGAPP